ncbi:hypothetical protein IF803_23240 [Bradyrhizobium sp. UFLA06-06]
MSCIGGPSICMLSLLASVFCAGSPARAESYEFDERAARTTCEKAADSTKELNQQLRPLVVDTCVGLQRRNVLAAAIAFKRQYVPKDLYDRCSAIGGSNYQHVSDCIDRAVLAMPRGSVDGYWRLQQVGEQDRIYWDISDCQSARARGPGGVCISY